MRDSNTNFNCLHKTCTFVMVLSFLHIVVTLFYYVRSMNFNETFLQSQENQIKVRNNTEETEEKTNLITLHLPAVSTKELKELKELEKCPDPSPLLVGPLQITFSTPVSLEQVRNENLVLQEGGRYKPKDCTALQKVAIIIPFRHRDEHLTFWLYYLHPILQKQQLDYGVFVINQDGNDTFNRAKLMNVGFAEALKEYDYDCFVFSDVDIIPMDDRNMYKCFSQPRHLSVAIDKFGFRLPYKNIFGGVSAMSKEQFQGINGFPNNYWGWGGEDDDIFKRLRSKGMSIERPDVVIGKCRMIHHKRDKENNPNPKRFDRLAHTIETMDKDGINSLSYNVVKVEKDQLFTKITVDIGQPPNCPTYPLC